MISVVQGGAPTHHYTGLVAPMSHQTIMHHSINKINQSINNNNNNNINNNNNMINNNSNHVTVTSAPLSMPGATINTSALQTTYSPLTIDSTYGHMKHESSNQSMQYDRDAGEESPTSSDSGGCNRTGSKGSNGRPNRDPLSHRIIEKRRRDRMNNCLSNLSKMIPSHFLKKGRGRIEKTEIIEMAIRYMQQLHEDRRQPTTVVQPEPVYPKNAVPQSTHTPSSGTVVTTYPVSKPIPIKKEEKAVATDVTMTDLSAMHTTESTESLSISTLKDRYKQGYFDCIAETLRFLAIAEGLQINESTKTQLLFHLREYFSRSTYDVLGSAFTDLLTVAQTQYKPAVIVPPRSAQSHSSSVHPNDVVPPCAPSLTVTPAVEPVSPCSSDQPLNMSIKSSMCTSSNGTQHLRSMLSVNGESSHQPHHHPKPAHSSTHSKEHTSSSGTYPSSPGSSRSLSGVSTTSYTPDSPPRVLSPRSSRSQQREVPVFALHSSGMYYVPLNLQTQAMPPSHVHVLTHDVSKSTSQQCHPVTIPVNFTAAANLEQQQQQNAGKHGH